VALTAEWRTNDEIDTVLIVDTDSNTVRQAFKANPDILSDFLTDTGDLNAWSGEPFDDARRNPDAWGELVIARASTGEVLTMDPRLYWEGIFNWFRSRGVDYDTGRAR
jgi:hypothetical protein